MNTEEPKKDLLQDFEEFLEQSDLDTCTPKDQPDLSTLLSEMAGLKAEVKAETRHFKSTVDTLSSALEIVQNDNKTLTEELASFSRRLEQQQVDIMRNMLLDTIDLYDRLSAGLGVLKKYRPVTRLFKHSRPGDVQCINRFQEGQVMTLRRFDQFLQQHQVQPIECIGNMLDPATMNAVETDYDPQIQNGIVLEELRKGFLFQGQVLRLAEVKVNKTSTQFKTL